MTRATQTSPCMSPLPSNSVAEATPYRGLSRDEVERLAVRIADGDREARNLLVKANLGLVKRVARRYVGQGLSIDDLVGEGNLGLIRAAEEFDPGVGASFSTYATYWIRQSILSAVMNTGTTIRVPAHVFRLLIQWRRTEHSLGLAHGRPPTCEEVASVMGLSEHQKHLVLKARHARDLRLESVLPGGSHPWSSGMTKEGQEAPEDRLEADEERSCLRQWLCRLDSRERTVLILRYGLGDERPMKLHEVGRRLGLSREWVRKVADQALRKLLDSSAANQAEFLVDGGEPNERPRSKACKSLPDTCRSPVGLEPASGSSPCDGPRARFGPEAPAAGQDAASLAMCG